MGSQEKKVVVNYDSEENNNIVERIKHPLRNTWSFWMYTNKMSNWEENLVKLTTFETVEDYWCLYHHMKCPTDLELGQEYAIFKEDIRPMWEDKANRFGGRWLINFENKNDHLNSVWLHLVLLLIGENFQNSNAICGIFVHIRTKSKIGIWISNSKNKKAVMEVGKILKNQLSSQYRINFHEHNSHRNMYTL